VSEPIHDVERASGASERPLSLGDIEGSEESMRHFLELIRVLDEKGVLRLVHDLVEDNEEIVRAGVDWMSRPENVRAIQGVRAVGKAAGMLEPDRLEGLVTALARATDRASTLPRDDRRRGVLSVLRQLGEPEVNRGLQIFIEFLRALGEADPGRPPVTAPRR
jgi:uncharacterized protein YjgD (DUF1641 family)